MPVKVILVCALLVPLAGCFDLFDTVTTSSPGLCREGGRGEESHQRITLTLEGPYDVAVPVPLSEGTTFDDWLDRSGGQRWMTPDGPTIRLQGEGPEVLSWCHIVDVPGSCCAEQYLDRTWSAMDNGTVIGHVMAGALTLEYEALSAWCGTEEAFTSQGTGRQTWEAFGGGWCT